jgi:AcrR family transcriptional regulator
MTLDAAELGLRERKRIATRRAIQVAAVRLAADDGLERLTIDEIGRRADISPRTFFNYFPSKEAALMGDTPQLPGDESVARFVDSRDDLITGLGAIVVEAVEQAAEDRELTQLRRVVMKRYPELFALRIFGMKKFEDELQAVVQERLLAESPEVYGDEGARASRARLITLVALAAMRHAWSCWADAGGTSELTPRLLSSFAELEDLLASSAAK